MTQADCVLSTPPTNTPTDTTRRRFLTVAGVASVVSASSRVAAAMATSEVPHAVIIPRHRRDPVFGLIEAHRKACRDHEAALVEQERLERIGDNAADWVGEAP